MRPISKAGRTSGARGITLIEMMVVTIVIALIVSISTPSVTAGIDSVRLATATSSVASFLNSAVTRAERRQRPVEVVITPHDNRMQFYSTDAGSMRELTLPDGIVVEAVLPEVLNSVEVSRRVLLMPGGTVPGIGVQLANGHGARRIVRLDPMTGFPRVERLEDK